MNLSSCLHRAAGSPVKRHTACASGRVHSLVPCSACKEARQPALERIAQPIQPDSGAPAEPPDRRLPHRRPLPDGNGGRSTARRLQCCSTTSASCMPAHTIDTTSAVPGSAAAAAPRSAAPAPGSCRRRQCSACICRRSSKRRRSSGAAAAVAAAQQPGGAHGHCGQHTAAGLHAALGTQAALLPSLDVWRVGGEGRPMNTINRSITT